MAEEFIFSQAGREKLEQKLKEYETVKRRELIARIAEAREYGDLS
ncbi:MAG: transcription elongation factor GreA, partial [Christensenellales bacterium]